MGRDRSTFTSIESANDRTCFLQESVMQARRQQIIIDLAGGLQDLIHPKVISVCRISLRPATSLSMFLFFHSFADEFRRMRFFSGVSPKALSVLRRMTGRVRRSSRRVVTGGLKQLHAVPRGWARRLDPWRSTGDDPPLRKKHEYSTSYWKQMYVFWRHHSGRRCLAVAVGETARKKNLRACVSVTINIATIELRIPTGQRRMGSRRILHSSAIMRCQDLYNLPIRFRPVSKLA